MCSNNGLTDTESTELKRLTHTGTDCIRKSQGLLYVGSCCKKHGMEEQGSHRELAPKERVGLCMLRASFPSSSCLAEKRHQECCTSTVPATGKETSGVEKKSSTNIMFNIICQNIFSNNFKIINQNVKLYTCLIWLRFVLNLVWRRYQKVRKTKQKKNQN